MIAITKQSITEGLERESSLLSVNLKDNNNVSLYDRVFIYNDSILGGAISEAVNIVLREAARFVVGYEETVNQYTLTLKKEPYAIHDDILNYIVCYTMFEWCTKSLQAKDNTFATRAAASLKSVLKKLYFKEEPV